MNIKFEKARNNDGDDEQATQALIKKGLVP